MAWKVFRHGAGAALKAEVSVKAGRGSTPQSSSISQMPVKFTSFYEKTSKLFIERPIVVVRNYSGIVQLVEPKTLNLVVVGSTPTS